MVDEENLLKSTPAHAGCFNLTNSAIWVASQ
jgi:hypothetical protein